MTTLPRSVVSEADREIIQLLQQDGRRSVASISKITGLPQSTVRRRVNQLLADGTLSVVAIPDTDRIGLPIHVIMAVHADVSQGDAVGTALVALDEVRWVALTAGQWDFILEAFFGSINHFHDFLVEKIGRIPGVQRTETLTVVRLFKESYEWSKLLKAAETRSGASEASNAND